MLAWNLSDMSTRTVSYRQEPISNPFLLSKWIFEWKDNDIRFHEELLCLYRYISQTCKKSKCFADCSIFLCNSFMWFSVPNVVRTLKRWQQIHVIIRLYTIISISILNSLVHCQTFTPRVLPKHLDCFGKFVRHRWLESRFNYVSNPYPFISSNQSPHTNTYQDHYQAHAQQRQWTD